MLKSPIVLSIISDDPHYASLIVDISITPENICVYRMVLKCNSENKTVFMLSISERLSQLDFYTLDSITGLDLLSEIIS